MKLRVPSKKREMPLISTKMPQRPFINGNQEDSSGVENPVVAINMEVDLHGNILVGATKATDPLVDAMAVKKSTTTTLRNA